MTSTGISMDRTDRYPNLQRSLMAYLNDPRNKLRQDMPVKELVDSFLKTVGIVIPEREKKDRHMVDKYFARAEFILSQKTLFS